MRSLTLLFAILVLTAHTAFAQFVIENGDAGSTLSTSQQVSVPCEEIHGIQGETFGTDTDLFRCTATREGILYESDFGSSSAGGMQFLVDILANSHEEGFMELGIGDNVRTKRHITSGRDYLIGTGSTLSWMTYSATL